MNNEISKLLRKYYGIYDFNIDMKEKNSYFIKNKQDNKKYVLVKKELNNEETFKITNSNLFINNVLYKKVINIKKSIYYMYENKNESIENIKLEDILKYIKTQNLNKKSQLNLNDIINKWETKVDYIEKMLVNNKEYDEKLSCYINYFIGISEFSIQYLKNFLNTKTNRESFVSCNVFHRRLDQNIRNYEMFDPFNFIIDNKVRDISEFIKKSIYNKQDDEIKKEIEQVKESCLSSNEYYYMTARLIFPTDFYDNIEEYLFNNKNNDFLIKTINHIDKYEKMINYILNNNS